MNTIFDLLGPWGLAGAGCGLGLLAALVALKVAAARRDLGDAAESAEADHAEAEGYRATFCEAVERARACQSAFDEKWVGGVLERFDEILAKVSKEKNQEVRENLVGRAEELERLRAFVLPEDDLLLQGKTSLADMIDWGVPRATLRTIREDLIVTLDKGKLLEKRSALQKIFDFYDAWYAHVEGYEAWSKGAAKRLTIALTAFLTVALVCALVWWPVFAFLAAGMTGAIVSIMAKMPPMLGWGQWATYTPRILGRLATGLAGTIVGGAFLAIGVVTVGGDGTSFRDVIGATTAPSAFEPLYLLGVGIVLGFSERLLVRLDPFRSKASAAAKSAAPSAEDN